MNSMRKRFVGIFVAAVLLISCSISPIAFAVEDGSETPLIVINGFSSVPLVQDAGTLNEIQVFPLSAGNEQAMAENITTGLVWGMYRVISGNKDWDGFCDEFLPPIYDILEPLSYNLDGTPKYDNVTNVDYLLSLDNYPEEDREEIATVFGNIIGDEIGLDNVYAFGYDWREDPIKSAGELDSFIELVKTQTGESKVNILAISMGSSIALSYLSEYAPLDNYASINNVVFASPAWQGTSLLGNAMTGNVQVEPWTLENYLVQIANGNAITHLGATLASTIATFNGLTWEYVPDINKLLNNITPRIYSDIVIPIFAGMPGIWSMIPADYYDAAKAFIFPEGINPELEAKIDAYHAIQTNAKAIVSAAMDAGVNFSVVSNYNLQIIPIAKGAYNTSDGVIDTVYSSGGATCAKILGNFDKGYQQAAYTGHNQVSPDNRIDATTCMFPNNTWFYQDVPHAKYEEENGTTDLIVWLLLSDESVNVFTDTENYPQFILLNTYENKAVPTVVEDYLMKGDVDNSGKVSVEDARLALRSAVGLEALDAFQLGKADYDADSTLSVDDARTILRVAVGLQEVEYTELVEEAE